MCVIVFACLCVCVVVSLYFCYQVIIIMLMSEMLSSVAAELNA